MPDKLSLRDFREHLRDLGPEEIIRDANDYFEGSISVTTAFGYSGIVMMHMFLQVHPDLEVYFIDTGFHFPKTHEFKDQLKAAWGLKVKEIKPRMHKEELDNILGPEPYKKNPDLCCLYNKVEPLLTFVHDKQAWMSGIRRDQSETRAGIDVIDKDGRGVIKVHPLYNWTREQTWDYLKQHNLPYHPMHDEGYPSIGCAPCTARVSNGDGERDGRWPLMQKLECGIHLGGS